MRVFSGVHLFSLGTQTQELMNTIKGLAGIVGLLLIVNVITHRLDIQFDLTSDHKYSLDDLSICILYTSPSPRYRQKSRMPSSA